MDTPINPWTALAAENSTPEQRVITNQQSEINRLKIRVERLDKLVYNLSKELSEKIITLETELRKGKDSK